MTDKTARSTSPDKDQARNLFNDYKKQHPNTKLSPQDFYAPATKKQGPANGDTKPTTNAPKGSFFAEKAKNAPDVATQKIKDPEKLFKQAKETHEKQLDWLNRGKGIDSVIGATVVRGDNGDKGGDYLTKKGPVVIIGPMKEKKRSEEKVTSKFGGDWSRLNDIVRASIAVDSFDDIGSVVAALEKSGIKLAEKPDDRFANPTEAGYRDLALKVTYDNGHVGELQIHLKSVIKAKEAGHKLYEKTRSISAAAQKEGRDTLTEDEQKTVDEANAQMRELYANAWKSAGGGGKKSSSKVAAEKKFYKFEGFAAEWEYKKFPKVYWASGAETHYDIENFFRTAGSVSKAEFEKLKGKPTKKSSMDALCVKIAHRWLQKQGR